LSTPARQPKSVFSRLLIAVTVTVSGFSRAHFDLYGYEDKVQGEDMWSINPCNHDSAYVQGAPIPAPGPLMLGAIGAVFGAWLRTRKML